MEHLRCEYEGSTFAVMEDFVEEYRYCADATPSKPLTVERLRRLTNGVLANTVRPDKVRAASLPHIGPDYTLRTPLQNPSALSCSRAKLSLRRGAMATDLMHCIG